MAELDVPIHDLYGFVEPRTTELQKPKNVHFTAEGYRQLGQRVAQAFRLRAGWK